uniref:Cytochrome c oxidase subunit 2 n=2 Tax=Lumbriculus variegatus TaxID=61662 RepID=A0A7D6W8X1_9ANNE|nr:cytochrome c oxidase subunit II [Lumbriculus variegatus]QLY89737.1 cytochrome c oxidase subunit II [Lumbriculus variegatus]UZT67749.1 cytochrome c oxidase subunit II [Lumbriculus variegatus]FAA04217.1 TPA: cytochrome c oxidase subunit II [Lumbriculus variegatus]
MPFWGQLSLQDGASPVMIQLIQFHDHALLVLTLVMTVIGYALVIIMTNKYTNRQILEAQEIETIWTILPAMVLLFLAIPSLRLLYIMDEITSPSVTLKAIGHQWYWSYEYSDFMSVDMDSYMTPTSDLKLGEYRLLETDNRVVLPTGLEIRMLITAADVIHSWAIPSLGVKVDAIPGRLNQIGFTILLPGLYFGQCSEICGANHTFMPIAIEAINSPEFIKWVTKSSS